MNIAFVPRQHLWSGQFLFQCSVPDWGVSEVFIGSYRSQNIWRFQRSWGTSACKEKRTTFKFIYTVQKPALCACWQSINTVRVQMNVARGFDSRQSRRFFLCLVRSPISLLGLTLGGKFKCRVNSLIHHKYGKRPKINWHPPNITASSEQIASMI